MSAHEVLSFRLETGGVADHPANRLYRDLIDEHAIALQALALAEERVADLRRKKADQHETLMRVLESCIPFVNQLDWSDAEIARSFLQSACEAYGVINR